MKTQFGIRIFIPLLFSKIHKNGTARQLNYCCIQSINGDMKREENIFLHVHIFAQYHKLRMWMTESVNDLITLVLAYY